MTSTVLLKKDIKNMDHRDKSKSKFRELMKIVMDSSLKVGDISIIACEDINNGYVEVYVPLANMGLTMTSIRNYKKEIFTNMFVNFIAELIARENIEEFLKPISEIGMEDYPEVLGNNKHETS